MDGARSAELSRSASAWFSGNAYQYLLQVYFTRHMDDIVVLEQRTT